MRLGFITLGARVPSTRFRFFAYRDDLERQGHRCRFWTSHPSVYDYYKSIGWRMSHRWKRAVRYMQWLDCRWYRPECIYLERDCLHDPSMDLDLRFRRATPRLVLDVDDGIFLQFPEKIPKMIQMSDHVVVSNRPLFDYVSRFHDKITMIPTAVSMARYRAKPIDCGNRKPVIGWIGTGPNVAFLQVCAASLRRLASERDFQLFIVASSMEHLASIDLTGVDLQFIPWSAEREIEDLHRMDIGLMPLPTGQDWMRYKAATKLVQYLAVGLPAVASPIGVNAEILEGNRAGFAVDSEDEWFEAMRFLLDHPERREEMGKVGRELVRAQYSIESNGPILSRVLSGTS